MVTSTYLKVRKYGRRVLLAGILLSITTGVFWYRHVQREKGGATPPPQATRIDSKAQMVTRDFRHVETRLNETEWILEAAVAEFFQQEARLLQVKITYFGGGKEPTVITGRYGLVNLETWDAVLLGNVRAVGSDGTVMKTKELEYRSRDEMLLAPWPVKIKSPLGTIEGRSMEASLAGNWFRIVGRVATEFRPPRGLLEPAS